MNTASRPVRTLFCSTILLACSGSTNSSSHDTSTGGASGGGLSNSGGASARGGLSGVGGTVVTAGGSPSNGGTVSTAGGGRASTSATSGGTSGAAGGNSSGAGSSAVPTIGGSSNGGSTASVAGASNGGAPTNGGTSTMVVAGTAGVLVQSGGAAATGGAASHAGTSGNAGTTAGSAGTAATGGSTATCGSLRIVSLGKPGPWGCSGDTAVLEPWVNTTTNAHLTSVTERTTITAQFLAQYDIVITQGLGDTNTGPFWSFSQQEKDALAQWVAAGGGLMTLQGFSEEPSEIAPTNQLLEFSSITYNSDFVLTSCASLDPNCYCWGLSVPFGGLEPTSPIWAHLKNIPISIGRSIKPGTATAIASDATLVYAATTTVGAGRVFAFSDDWITYQSQWKTGCMPAPTSTADPCYGNTAADKYRMSQFWYNALKWLGGAKACDLRVSDPTVVL